MAEKRMIPPVNERLLSELISSKSDGHVYGMALRMLREHFKVQNAGSLMHEPSEEVVRARTSCAASPLPDERSGLRAELAVEAYYRRMFPKTGEEQRQALAMSWAFIARNYSLLVRDYPGKCVAIAFGRVVCVGEVGSTVREWATRHGYGFEVVVQELQNPESA